MLNNKEEVFHSAGMNKILEQMLNRIISGMLVLGALGAPASLLRIFSTGSQPVYYVHVFVAISIFVLFLTRNALGAIPKSIVLIILLLGIGIPAFLTFGFYSAALFWFVSAALVASGTATLEAALMECPMAVVYKTSPATYRLGKLLVRVPHIGMVNLVAQREVCPEFIQQDARPEALAGSIRPLLDDTPARQTMVAGLREVDRKLGEGRAAERTAACVLESLQSGVKRGEAEGP